MQEGMRDILEESEFEKETAFSDSYLCVSFQSSCLDDQDYMNRARTRCPGSSRWRPCWRKVGGTTLIRRLSTCCCYRLDGVH